MILMTVKMAQLSLKRKARWPSLESRCRLKTNLRFSPMMMLKSIKLMTLKNKTSIMSKNQKLRPSRNPPKRKKIRRL